MKARLIAQGVEHGKLVGGELDLFGDEAVFAAGLVLRANREGVERAADPGHGERAPTQVEGDDLVGRAEELGFGSVLAANAGTSETRFVC